MKRKHKLDQPDGIVELTESDYRKIMDFVRETAKLTKDGECVNCGKDGFDENDDCDDHEPWDMPNDDAVDTLHDLINEARALLEGGK